VPRKGRPGDHKEAKKTEKRGETGKKPASRACTEIVGNSEAAARVGKVLEVKEKSALIRMARLKIGRGQQILGKRGAYAGRSWNCTKNAGAKSKGGLLELAQGWSRKRRRLVQAGTWRGGRPSLGGTQGE